MITIEVEKNTSRIYVPTPTGGHLLVSMDAELHSVEERKAQRVDSRRLIEALADFIREGHPVEIVYAAGAREETS